MKKTYQIIINNLINYLYSRPDQDSSRKILISYFTQVSNRRELTLDELGVIGEVTRERARQIRDGFYIDFPRKIKRLANGHNESQIDENSDLRNFRDIIREIIQEINLFERPVFAKNIQDDLQSKGIIDQHIYMPLICRLAKLINIDTNFKVEDFNGNSIVVDLVDEKGKFTEGVISYAAKIARHCSGVFSVESLINSEWNPEAPKSIDKIPSSIRRSFVLDILGTDPSLMLLQGSDFFAFRERDERISNVLIPIFYSYRTPIEKTILMGAVQRTITLRLKQESDSRLRKEFVGVLEKSGSAMDEYCRRTLLLDTENVHYRLPGVKLAKEIKNFQLGGILENQLRILEKIRSSGGPVSHVLFGEFLRDMPDAQNSHFYSYPTLFYKEGEGRKHDLYKTLDGNYENTKSTSGGIPIDKSLDLENRVIEIRDKIKKLLEEQKSFDLLSDEKVTHRAEQKLLRELLTILSPKARISSNLFASRCQICNKYYPDILLVAAHVKPRSKCSLGEKADIENIAMLQCKSCDALYENGYISIDENGIVISADNLPMTEDLKVLVFQIAGNSCDYVNGNLQRLSYLGFHRENVFNNYVQ